MDNNTRSRGKQAFLLALLVAALIYLPFVIYDKGYFIYYGDFNVQQIPFYKLAHEAVRSGDIFWSWYTDLGANFMGSYSFYLLFSPFFWLTLPFPTWMVPYLMAPLLVLKTACAALTSYWYLHRFVRDSRYAVLGSLLYAFSGWMLFNVFFNHFHDVAVFFPLLLLGVEKLVKENKRGFFAAMVALCAIVNYWFFVGEVVFVILYVIIRMTDKSFGMTLKRFLVLALESVLGVGLAALVLLPSVMALMGNPRTGTDELLTGWRLWLYYHEQRQPAVIQSLFFPPERVARPNFLPDHGAKWASLSAWLPLFSMTGVLAYFFHQKNNWLKKLLALCLLFALVPGLNSLFILLNNSYYARWYYMPLLLMSLVTVRALESCEPAHFRRSLKWSAIIVVAFTVMSGLTPNWQDGELVFGMADRPVVMWQWAGVALGCLVITALVVLLWRRHPQFIRIATICMMVVSVGFSILYISGAKYSRDRAQTLIDTAINGRDNISLPDDGHFYRIDVYDGTDNLGMYWHLPSIQAFHSIVPASVMDFYPSVGVKRDVGSRPEEDTYALRPLLSVRYLFIKADKSEQQPMPGYQFYAEQNGYNIYENTNFIPMGFAYDYYITRDQLEEVEESLRGNLLLKAMVLEDEDSIQRNRDILAPYPSVEDLELDEYTMMEDVNILRETTAGAVARDNLGFTALTALDTTQLLFFSVPYEAGWSARLVEMDGVTTVEELTIEKANIGFMAVRVPAGNYLVRFDYRTPGLFLGLAVTGGTAVVFLLYLLTGLGRRKRLLPLRKQQKAAFRQSPQGLCWDEYLSQYPAEGTPAIPAIPATPEESPGSWPVTTDELTESPAEPEKKKKRKKRKEQQEAVAELQAAPPLPEPTTEYIPVAPAQPPVPGVSTTDARIAEVLESDPNLASFITIPDPKAPPVPEPAPTEPEPADLFVPPQELIMEPPVQQQPPAPPQEVVPQPLVMPQQPVYQPQQENLPKGYPPAQQPPTGHQQPFYAPGPAVQQPVNHANGGVMPHMLQQQPYAPPQYPVQQPAAPPAYPQMPVAPAVPVNQPPASVPEAASPYQPVQDLPPAVYPPIDPDLPEGPALYPPVPPGQQQPVKPAAPSQPQPGPDYQAQRQAEMQRYRQYGANRQPAEPDFKFQSPPDPPK